MMQTDVQTRKARGRLSRHVQNKLGETLHAMFDQIVKEGVPDRFSRLLEQIESNNGSRGAQGGVPASDRGEPFTKSSERDPSGSKADVRAKGPDRPFRKPDDEGSS
jgi:Anti-sigma factor NepR